MSEVTLSIPFVVTSTRLSPLGEVEKHVLTPFGDLDVTIHAISMEDSKELVVDIQMGEGADRWIMADPSLVHFRKTLVCFVRGLLPEILGESLEEVAQGQIQFWGSNGEFLFLDFLKNGVQGLPTGSVHASVC